MRDSGKISILRDALLQIAGGFTEISPGELLDLIPGDGLGYIVAFDDEDEVELAGKVQKLAAKVTELAEAWKLPLPSISPASDGPRGKHCFFLIPKQSNRDPKGHRRDLFLPERWARLKETLRERLSHPVKLIYGEWLPKESYRKKDSDVSYIFIFSQESGCDEAFLRDFIESQVFDRGTECDQETIYLSVLGHGTCVYDPEDR